MFLAPRRSVVDIVQSVGRVMRKDEESGKQFGYIILPIGIPPGMTPEEALRDNKRYAAVWEILEALRAHDERFDALVNRISLSKARDNGSAARTVDSWLGRLVGGLAHDEFVFDGGQAAERGLAPAAVVGAFDPGDDREAQLLAGVPGLAAEDVLLQQAEEALHGGVVAGGADLAH